MKMPKIVFVFMLVINFAPVFSVEEIKQFDNSDQELLYQKLIVELRCLVCQNQNIADSNAELAQDLRGKTYELIKQGKDESEIKSYMRNRFGDFVLYAPELNQQTSLLWFAPVLVLLGGLIWFFTRIFVNQGAQGQGKQAND